MKSLLSICFVLFVVILNAQFSFIDDSDWGSGKATVTKADSTLSLIIVPEKFANKDTIEIKYFYPNKKLAIEGKAIIVDGTVKWKIGQWKFYYKNSKLWSLRSYNAKGGLISIDTLISPNGKMLSKGFIRIASLMKAMTGYAYFYNDKGDLFEIFRYNGGSIREKINVGKYSEAQLNRVIIREFNNIKGPWEELSLDEALQLQNKNKKPIFLQISNGYNGYTHKGYKNLYPENDINNLLYENFICAYLDLNDTKPISAMVNGQNVIYEGMGKQFGVHEAASTYLKSINGTPYFVFIEDGKMVYSYFGIELEKEKFLKILEFYLSGNYKTEDWAVFKKSLNK